MKKYCPSNFHRCSLTIEIIKKDENENEYTILTNVHSHFQSVEYVLKNKVYTYNLRPIDNKYFYTTHSELNAILNYRGGSLEGTKLYVSLFPCNECAKAIIQAGIKTIIYDCDKYASTPSVIASKRMLEAAGVEFYKYEASGRKISIEL